MANFKACIKCVAPKRHPGCQDTCPEHQGEKQDYENKKALIRQAKQKEKSMNDYQAAAMHRMKVNRGKNIHAK